MKRKAYSYQSCTRQNPRGHGLFGIHVTLENTAGQGSNLGWDFAQLGAILSGVKVPERIGICIDTCHAFAAGYELAEPEKYEVTMEKLNEAVGLEKVLAFHLNDSKGAFGSRKDRHEMIGEGEMGLEPFGPSTIRDFNPFPCTWKLPKAKEQGRTTMRSTSPPSGILLAISIEGEAQEKSHLCKFMTMMDARSFAHESTWHCYRSG